jgi:hypothetical protein
MMHYLHYKAWKRPCTNYIYLYVRSFVKFVNTIKRFTRQWQSVMRWMLTDLSYTRQGGCHKITNIIMVRPYTFTKIWLCVPQRVWLHDRLSDAKWFELGLQGWHNHEECFIFQNFWSLYFGPRVQSCKPYMILTKQPGHNRLVTHE